MEEKKRVGRQTNVEMQCADAGPNSPRSQGLFFECLEFVREQSSGEWGDAVERSDALKLAEFVARQRHEAGVTAASDVPIPPNEWIYEQARNLSASKTEDAIGALAWNLSVAFRRWSETAQASIPPALPTPEPRGCEP